MPKVTVTSAQGLVQSAGSGITFESTPITTVQAKTAAATIGAPGVYTVSGAAALGMTMPAASTVPGGIFVFRSLSEHAHFLTGSAEAAGTKVFKAPVTGSTGGSGGQAQGSKATLTDIIGASITLISDGLSFCVMTNSGSVTYSGT